LQNIDVTQAFVLCAFFFFFFFFFSHYPKPKTTKQENNNAKKKMFRPRKRHGVENNKTLREMLTELNETQHKTGLLDRISIRNSLVTLQPMFRGFSEFKSDPNADLCIVVATNYMHAMHKTSFVFPIPATYDRCVGGKPQPFVTFRTRCTHYQRVVADRLTQLCDVVQTLLVNPKLSAEYLEAIGWTVTEFTKTQRRIRSLRRNMVVETLYNDVEGLHAWFAAQKIPVSTGITVQWLDELVQAQKRAQFWDQTHGTISRDPISKVALRAQHYIAVGANRALGAAATFVRMVVKNNHASDLVEDTVARDVLQRFMRQASDPALGPHISIGVRVDEKTLCKPNMYNSRNTKILATAFARVVSEMDGESSLFPLNSVVKSHGKTTVVFEHHGKHCTAAVVRLFRFAVRVVSGAPVSDDDGVLKQLRAFCARYYDDLLQLGYVDMPLDKEQFIERAQDLAACWLMHSHVYRQDKRPHEDYSPRIMQSDPVWTGPAPFIGADDVWNMLLRAHFYPDEPWTNMFSLRSSECYKMHAGRVWLTHNSDRGDNHTFIELAVPSCKVSTTSYRFNNHTFSVPYYTAGHGIARSPERGVCQSYVSVWQAAGLMFLFVESQAGLRYFSDIAMLSKRLSYVCKDVSLTTVVEWTSHTDHMERTCIVAVVLLNDQFHGSYADAFCTRGYKLAPAGSQQLDCRGVLRAFETLDAAERASSEPGNSVLQALPSTITNSLQWVNGKVMFDVVGCFVQSAVRGDDEAPKLGPWCRATRMIESPSNFACAAACVAEELVDMTSPNLSFWRDVQTMSGAMPQDEVSIRYVIEHVLSCTSGPQAHMARGVWDAQFAWLFNDPIACRALCEDGADWDTLRLLKFEGHDHPALRPTPYPEHVNAVSSVVKLYVRSAARWKRRVVHLTLCSEAVRRVGPSADDEDVHWHWLDALSRAKIMAFDSIPSLSSIDSALLFSPLEIRLQGFLADTEESTGDGVVRSVFIKLASAIDATFASGTPDVPALVTYIMANVNFFCRGLAEVCVGRLEQVPLYATYALYARLGGLSLAADDALVCGELPRLLGSAKPREYFGPGGRCDVRSILDTIVDIANENVVLFEQMYAAVDMLEPSVQNFLRNAFKTIPPALFHCVFVCGKEGVHIEPKAMRQRVYYSNILYDAKDQGSNETRKLLAYWILEGLTWQQFKDFVVFTCSKPVHMLSTTDVINVHFYPEDDVHKMPVASTCYNLIKLPNFDHFLTHCDEKTHAMADSMHLALGKDRDDAGPEDKETLAALYFGSRLKYAMYNSEMSLP
jgi:hypothetical protein